MQWMRILNVWYGLKYFLQQIRTEGSIMFLRWRKTILRYL